MFSLRRRRVKGDLLPSPTGSGEPLEQMEPRLVAGAPRTGQKLEHRKLHLSRRQVYFTMGVEQVVRGVVETLSFKIFKT